MSKWINSVLFNLKLINNYAMDMTCRCTSNILRSRNIIKDLLGMFAIITFWFILALFGRAFYVLGQRRFSLEHPFKQHNKSRRICCFRQMSRWFWMFEWIATIPVDNPPKKQCSIRFERHDASVNFLQFCVLWQ